ncbi:putative inorganic carbon transporter subunit DabA [Mycolicibacterium aichiense]|uniref:putative inorganic carbon transporter subunit DabA n=1 Tax=Mycolicibacterium aichiense TaxID=1799 RepID=UPI003D669780
MTATESTTIEARRARLRGDVALAARVLPAHYPLETFIAVNPLSGLENMPFEQAIRRAGDVYGTPGTLRIKDFRQMHGAGRVTDADLDAALSRRYPNLAGAEPLRFGGAT